MATRVVKAGDTLSKIALQEGVNVSDISGFRSGNPDLIFPNEVLTINKPIDRNTVVTGGTNVGTVPSPRPDLTGFDRSLQDKALDDLIRDAFRGSQKKVDENKIRQDNLRFFQSEIDAVNQIYDEVLRGERIEGRDREGQGRAIRNRQGLIGSARGEKQREDIVEQNLSIERGIQAERAAKIGSIMGTARQSSIAEIRAETDAKRQSASDYLQFLTLQDDRTDKRVKQAVTALMLQGFKFEDLEGNEIDELTKNLRISKDALAAKFSELTPEAEGNQILSEGQVIVDKDGNIVFKNPRTFAPKAGSKTTPTPTSTTETPEGTVISFEEFRSSERGREELDRLQEAAKQTFTTARADEVLRIRHLRQSNH
jgi:hypothetical protein